MKMTNEKAVKNMRDYVTKSAIVSTHFVDCLCLCSRLEAADATIKRQRTALEAVRKCEETLRAYGEHPPITRFVVEIANEIAKALAKAEVK